MDVADVLGMELIVVYLLWRLQTSKPQHSDWTIPWHSSFHTAFLCAFGIHPGPQTLNPGVWTAAILLLPVLLSQQFCPLMHLFCDFFGQNKLSPKKDNWRGQLPKHSQLEEQAWGRVWSRQLIWLGLAESGRKSKSKLANQKHISRLKSRPRNP